MRTPDCNRPQKISKKNTKKNKITLITKYQIITIRKTQYDYVKSLSFCNKPHKI